ncbi:MAG: hypothetical protein Q4C50_03205, partial [Eubacteriales bacterium]|nr:hypothetical protein [Eubacteriales bacterium]
RLYLVSGLLCGPGPQMASSTSKPPSKPVQPQIIGVWSADDISNVFLLSVTNYIAGIGSRQEVFS